MLTVNYQAVKDVMEGDTFQTFEKVITPVPPTSLPLIRRFVTTIVPDGLGRYLAIHLFTKKERPWRFAGGKVEPGELPVSAAVRELKEETGLQAKQMVFLDMTDPHTVDSGTWQGMYFFAPSVIGEPKITETDKIDQIAYLTKEELRERGSNPEADMIDKMEKWGLTPCQK